MPELREEDAPSLVHGIDDWLPGRQLLVLVEARRIRVPGKVARGSLKPACGSHTYKNGRAEGILPMPLIVDAGCLGEQESPLHSPLAVVLPSRS
jgi:hypothetical protein